MDLCLSNKTKLLQRKFIRRIERTTRPICMWCTWPRSCHQVVTVFFCIFLLFSFHVYHHPGTPSFMCISIPALDDRMHKSDFANRDFPLLLMIFRDKLPHRKQHAHLTFFKYTAAISVSRELYGWAITFTLSFLSN